ncbi:MAG: hypothetical protein NVS9B15_13760 [Acidobacteriaceae bacterium]
MLLLSLVAAGINLVVLWQVRRLRRRPASQWRMVPLSAHKRRMEHLQVALSILTILLVVAESLGHKHFHGVYL